MVSLGLFSDYPPHNLQHHQVNALYLKQCQIVDVQKSNA